MSKLFGFLITAVLAFSILSSASHAQNAQGNFKFTLFDVEGFSISSIITLDADFAARNEGLVIDSPFKVSILQQDNVTPLYNIGNGSNDEILKISFTTGNRDTPMEERQLIENIRFVSMVLPIGEPQQRLLILEELIKTQIFDSAVAGYEQPVFIGTKSSELDDLVVVEAVGKYVDPSIGLMYVHIIGYPNPNDANSIFAVSAIVADKFDFENYDDLARTGGGKTLGSFEYIND